MIFNDQISLVPTNLVQNQVRVDFDTGKYDRKPFPGQEEVIEQTWLDKTSQNHRLYNGPKFRLAEIEVEDKTTTLKVGLSSYKDMLGTHYASNASDLVADGHFDYTASALGVGAITVTSDDKVVLIQRSSWTGENANKIDRPGGHPEPELALKVRNILCFNVKPLYHPEPLKITRKKTLT